MRASVGPRTRIDICVDASERLSGLFADGTRIHAFRQSGDDPVVTTVKPQASSPSDEDGFVGPIRLKREEQ